MRSADPALRAARWLAAVPALFVLIWSTGFIVAKLAAPHAPPLGFLLLRFAGVVAVLLPVAWLMRAPWPRGPRAWMQVAVSGVLLQATYLGGVWAAIKLGMPAGVSALIVGAQPLLTAALVHGAGSRVGGREWTGLLAGFAGIVLVLSDRITLSGVGPAAIALNLLALAGITAGTLWQKRHGAAVDLRTGAIVQFSASFVVLLPLALAFEILSFDLVWEFWVALVWSVLALSIVAIFLLLTMIRHGRATQVASYMYLTPPMTALMAWAVFGETLGVLAWAGVLLTMAGVALVVTRKDRA